jgi:predicted RNA polymerase sigma factor
VRYDRLLVVLPAPVVGLNCAIAVAEREGRVGLGVAAGSAEHVGPSRLVEAVFVEVGDRQEGSPDHCSSS